MTEDKLVLGVAGMPGSGKSLVVELAQKEKGYEAVAMGDVVREETKKRNLQPTPENIGKVMLDLRQKDGSAVIAKRCVPKIAGIKGQKVIVDGIRSLDEIEEFKKHYSIFSLIAIHASPDTRFQRLYHRRRSDDASHWKVFLERDTRELSVGLGSAIAMAEEMVVNEEPFDVVKGRIRRILEKVENKWRK
ncbi:MAG: AAA family ATPase [Candidatus Bathyarchaeia archaeon]